MNYLSAKFSIVSIALILFLLPSTIFAQTDDKVCSSRGYTIETINGVFTDEDGAIFNRDSLDAFLSSTHNGEPLIIDYLLNKTHSILDITDTAIQKSFEGNTRQSADFIKIQTDASLQVKTQKLLLVAHSQGNFYANDLYKAVTENGDLPPQTIGVYSVGTPANHVAGDGKYLTSSTDKIIAGLAENLLWGKIMPTNDTINYKLSDDNGLGHSFSDVYLKYRDTEIISDIKWSLDRLSAEPTRPENVACISAPTTLTTLQKIMNPPLYAIDVSATLGIVGVVSTKNAVVGTYHLTESFANLAFKVEVALAKLAYHTTVAVAIWSYDTTIAVAKTGWGIASTIGSLTYSVLTGALSNGQLANNNSASVILATQSVQNLPSVSVNNNKASIIPTAPVANNQPVSIVTTPSQPQAVFVFEPKVQGDTGMPKLVFVGSFSGGSAGGQVMGTQSTAPVAEEVVVVDGEVANAGAALPAPALSVPQCAQTLATDGCLLATTTVHFEWADIVGVDHYLLNKNGTNATTTDTILAVEIKDFSDYTLEINSVGVSGEVSATSTQKISVATIPIAINEIAWMGTLASANDEWFEIKNNTTHTIDLSQWELNAKDGTPHVKLAGTIGPKEYLVFERIDNNVVADVTAHQTYTGALGNAGEQLNLSYASTTLDRTPVVINGAWTAGENSSTTKKTMERYSSRESGADQENWGTNLVYIKNGTDVNGNAIEGTPGAQNSVSTLINKGQDITSDLTLTADEERYVVPHYLIVDASSTLSIEPGVTISFLNDNQENYGYFIVKGEIIANGAEKNPVNFNSFSDVQAGGFWIDNSTGTSTFEYTNFENMNRSVSVEGGNLEIKNSQFINNEGGVESYGANTTVLIENTRFASSTSDTIGAYGSSVRISSSTITNQIDDDAIGLYNGSSLIMASTTIDGVIDGSGIYSYRSTLNISSSTIRNTEGAALSLAYSTTTLSNTIVQGGELNDWVTGIEVYHGTATITDTFVSGFKEISGIGIYEPSLPVVISGGEITGNAMGVEMVSADSVIMTDVSIHDNGSLDDSGVFVEKNVVVWPPEETDSM